MTILSIDPGNTMSAYCLIDSNNKPYEFAKLSNELLLDRIQALDSKQIQHSAIEMIASYGMPVGKEVFETCVWIGVYLHALSLKGIESTFVYRKEVKQNLCGSMKAKDSNIRQALIDRFGPVGTKQSQGWFYGFKSDEWAAYAVGVTYLDKIAQNQFKAV